MIRDTAEFGRLKHDVEHADVLHEDLIIQDIIEAEAAGDITEDQANELHGALFLRLHETRESFFHALDESQSH